MARRGRRPARTGAARPTTSLRRLALREVLRRRRRVSVTQDRVDQHPCVDWCPRCWDGWLRARLLEHLRGQRFWLEFDGASFGILRHGLFHNPVLLPEIEQRVAAGAENLAIISWVIDTSRPIGDAVAILRAIDLNARRDALRLVVTSLPARAEGTTSDGDPSD